MISREIQHPKVAILHVTLLSRGHGDAQQPVMEKRTALSGLEEAIGLAAAIHLDVVYTQIISLKKMAPSTLIGRGNVDALKGIFSSQDVELVVIDHTLSPVQQRNLEKTWGVKVIDRTGLIIEIFGDRARTAEGVLQVDLASLSYQRSRLVRSWTHLERQRGGHGFLGGPGESQLELDRRMIDEKIIRIRKELEQIKRTRSLHRDSRKRVPYPVIALVGYTNAGKSTLFNRLTGADVFAENLLFATLDPTMRQIKLPNGQDVILSDTVGFISDLPTQLVMAFRATLEEVQSADIILHVRDISHPDTKNQAADVYDVLKDLGIENPLESGRALEVHNKIDLLPPEEHEAAINHANRLPYAVAISSLTGEGCASLLEKIDQQLKKKTNTVAIDLTMDQGDILAWCYRRGAVVAREDDEEWIHLTLRLQPEEEIYLKKRLGMAVEIL